MNEEKMFYVVEWVIREWKVGNILPKLNVCHKS